LYGSEDVFSVDWKPEGVYIGRLAQGRLPIVKGLAVIGHIRRQDHDSIDDGALSQYQFGLLQLYQTLSGVGI